MTTRPADNPAPIICLIDPLCGWCYAATPQLTKLRAALGHEAVQILPTGLFSGAGARPMTPAFRDYAWQNDQRIARLSGQPFSQSYYDRVLSDFSVAFDSGPASLTLAMGEFLKAGSGLEILTQLQKARYVDGRDLCDSNVLLGIVAELGFDRRRFAAALNDPAQSEAAMEIITDGRRFLARHGLEAAPAMIVNAGGEQTLVPSTSLVDPSLGLVEALIAHFRNGASATPVKFRHR
jgi:putative protein-disulfide isomerase